jgi:hypothetical protein
LLGVDTQKLSFYFIFIISFFWGGGHPSNLTG